MQVLHEGAELPGRVSEISRALVKGAYRAVLVEYKLVDGRSAALLVRLTIDQSGYVGGLPDALEKPDLQFYAPGRKWDLEGWVFVAPQSYLDKVAAASGVPYTVSFEDFADDCCSEVAGSFSEGCERANAYFDHWGEPRNVPYWVMRR